MSARGAARIGIALVVGGCVYYNSIYNAETAFDSAEAHRRAGRDSVAAEAYGDVIRSAADGFRRDPGGEWAADALFLLGRARLRLGETAAAQAALEAAEELADDEDTRLSILVYRALIAERTGDPDRALELVNRALRGLDQGPALAEGHLLRGRLILSRGQEDAGWWDLDRAPVVDARIGTEATLERLRLAIELGERSRAEEAASRLLSDPNATNRLDSIRGLARAAAERWGPADAAALLQDADSASWGRTGRARARLLRAHLLREAGDTASAYRIARSVAGGLGEAAAEARTWLARETLARARDLADLESVRVLLLPASDQPGVAALLTALDEVVALADLGLEEPLGLFAAAELARDALGAPRLTRGLFLAYADSDPSDPWAPKALLAAIASSPDEGDRAWLRGRLEAHGDSPYVLAARGRAAPGFEALEEDLAVRLKELIRR